MRILLIEDDAFKAKRIYAYLNTQIPSDEVILARSVSAGLTQLFCPRSPDAVLLDMSLSTFDVGPRETGGRPQNFGGIAILEHMARRNLEIPVAVITQFETFPKDGKDLSLDAIRDDLERRYPRTFKGLIYYNSRETAWEQCLLDFIKDTQRGRASP